MKRSIKKILPYLLAFLIPMISLLVIFFYKEILNQNFVLLLSDLQYQYYQLLVKLKDILLTDSSILYSFSNGIGGAMLGAYSYYLASPLNLLVAFTDNIHLFITFLIVFKISMMGLTMFIYLKYHFKNQSSTMLVTFSILYALSLFIVANFFQIIWLDAFMLAPLVILGIDKIVDKNKPLLYGVCLFLTILSNYYIGYMVCVFSVLYFLYRYLLNRKKGVLKTFIITSILAGLTTAVLTIPTLLELINSKRFALFFEEGIFNLDFINNLSTLLIGTYKQADIINFSFAFLYCGLIVIPLIYFYFINKKINRKEKILSAIILFLLTIGILFNPINFFWHAISFPVGYNYRYIFLLIIFVLYLAVKSFTNLKNINKIHYYIITLIMLIICFVCSFQIKPIIVYLNAGLLLLYIYLLYIFDYKEINKNQLLVLISVLCLGEVYFNTHLVFIEQDFPYYYSFKGIEEEGKQYQELINDNSPFYRIEKEWGHYNDAFNYNYNGASVWLSTISNRQINFFKKIGYETGLGIYTQNPGIITDSLLGIKYYQSPKDNPNYEIIGSQPISIYQGYMFGKEYEEHFIYKNPYALSLGYMVDEAVKSEQEFLDAYKYQNDIITTMSGKECVYCPLQVKQSDEDYFITITDNKPIIISFSDRDYSGIEYDIYIYDTFMKTITDFNYSDIYLENNFQLGEEVKITVRSSKGQPNIYFYGLNFDNFISNIKELQDEQLIIEKFSDDYIKGTIDVLKEGTLFLSIPYDEGWTVLVDGKEVEYYSLCDNFIGLDLSQGKHEIELKYIPRGLREGIIVSSISLVSFVIYLKKRKR